MGSISGEAGAPCGPERLLEGRLCPGAAYLLAVVDGLSLPRGQCGHWSEHFLCVCVWAGGHLLRKARRAAPSLPCHPQGRTWA